MDKWFQQLHFVMKARTYLTGELAMKALSKKKIYYGIIASDTSESHLRSIEERLRFYQIPWIVTLSKSIMESLTHKKQVVFIGITNADLANILKEKESYHEKTSIK
ncbi:MAG: hypothetical protein ACO207_05055 [Bacilli bacterium]